MALRTSSLPLGHMARIFISGSINTTVVVNLTDTVSSILSIVGKSDARVIFSGQVLSPALSLMFYGIGDGSQVILLTPENTYQPPKPQGLYRNNSYTRLINDESKRVQKFFEEKCAGKVRDPEAVLQRFQDATNPMTALESARITDVYRSRIEANTNSFRRLCKKYRSLVELERCPKMSTPTILPEKAEEPSTELLPELIQQPINNIS
ncbi:hypothetical protein TRFO_12160 [Tritrichomonas foetus]|uniref:Ubiquitin-like domain-containing protein n=1 Tax=Tritrichomonas foetus TaxID=1144522 RepID=A0A1J4J5P6_9EUKA|nr:hypothetical protein TRFO_12160 [Tritrichomonas foetus]|eukprot:OHS92971.1 hypothetical protein TRFO_12160 [Tritrichomonas foetus]